MLILTVGSCASVEDTELQEVQSGSNGSHFSLGITEALSKANELRSATRIANITPKVDYVMRKNKGKRTRSTTEVSDTLAYIFNYPENGGFVIVSNDVRTKTILAYSDNGNYSTENEIAQKEFVDRIENYIYSRVSKASEKSYDEEDGDLVQVGPYVTTELGQHEPYNKVVDKYHPGCPVGCVPVACAMAVSHCVDKLTYKGCKYNFTEINKNIVNGYGDGDVCNPNIFGGGVDQTITWLNTYEGATSAISQLVYDFGKEMGTLYGPTVSNTISRLAYNHLLSLGFTLSEYFESYDKSEIINKLDNGWIVLQNGIEINSDQGHTWVIDGYKAIVNRETGSPIPESE